MRLTYRVAAVVGAALLFTAPAIAPAHAGGPTRVVITGPAIGTPLVFGNTTDAFTEMQNVIGGAGLDFGGGGSAPLAQGPAITGPHYLVAVDFHDLPAYVVELYPQASGGPHLYVPADQPTSQIGKIGQVGWYAASPDLVAEALRLAGLSGAQPQAAAATPAGSPAKSPTLAVAAAVVIGLTAMLIFVRRRRTTGVTSMAR